MNCNQDSRRRAETQASISFWHLRKTFMCLYQRQWQTTWTAINCYNISFQVGLKWLGTYGISRGSVRQCCGVRSDRAHFHHNMFKMFVLSSRDHPSGDTWSDIYLIEQRAQFIRIQVAAAPFISFYSIDSLGRLLIKFLVIYSIARF